jgi:hypothetical protein
LFNISYENECPSPDRSGNPFAFFFKKQKIETDCFASSHFQARVQEIAPNKYSTTSK